MHKIDRPMIVSEMSKTALGRPTSRRRICLPIFEGENGSNPTHHRVWVCINEQTIHVRRDKGEQPEQKQGFREWRPLQVQKKSGFRCVNLYGKFLENYGTGQRFSIKWVNSDEFYLEKYDDGRIDNIESFEKGVRSWYLTENYSSNQYIERHFQEALWKAVIKYSEKPPPPINATFLERMVLFKFLPPIRRHKSIFCKAGKFYFSMEEAWYLNEMLDYDTATIVDVYEALKSTIEERDDNNKFLPMRWAYHFPNIDSGQPLTREDMEKGWAPRTIPSKYKKRPRAKKQTAPKKTYIPQHLGSNKFEFPEQKIILENIPPREQSIPWSFKITKKYGLIGENEFTRYVLYWHANKMNKVDHFKHQIYENCDTILTKWNLKSEQPA